MRKLAPVLLIGTLSMLFAEVFSGASQMWYVSGWGLLLTFPLYSAHLLFFLNIAMKLRKTSLSQLYLFGVIFGLYESWITKVLWAGYIESQGPAMGTLFGVGISEFPVLVFFWHPIMSFILPIIVFEILTEKVIRDHQWILRKTAKKTILITLFLISIATFIANGNNYSPVSSDLSLIGTLLIIYLLYRLTKDMDLRSIELHRKSITVLIIYLFLLYAVSFFYLLPERKPVTVLPYLTVISFYIISIVLILKSKKKQAEMEILKENLYSGKDFLKFMIILILLVNISSLVPEISSVILMITYISFIFVGTVTFTVTAYRNIRRS